MKIRLDSRQCLQRPGEEPEIKGRRGFLVVALALSAVMLTVRPATAQYPNKPIRLIVPFAAGGPSDAAARSLGRTMSTSIGQAIVVDNVPGANGAIAARTARNAPPDGYTFLWGVGSMVAIPLLQKDAPLEAIANLAPIAMVGRFTFGMTTNPALPAKSVDEFTRYARANPDKINFGSATLGEFMAAAQFMKASRTSMTRVPYKGGAQVILDLLAGRVQVYFGPASLALPHVRDGKLRMLSILLPQRSPAVPDVPTMTEAGMPGVSIPSWQAIFGPPKTPRDVVYRMSSQVNLALNDPDVVAQFDQLMLATGGSTPDMLAAVIKQDVETWRSFIRENGISQE